MISKGMLWLRWGQIDSDAVAQIGTIRLSTFSRECDGSVRQQGCIDSLYYVVAQFFGSQEI
jgi:hypothetical protein